MIAESKVNEIDIDKFKKISVDLKLRILAQFNLSTYQNMIQMNKTWKKIIGWWKLPNLNYLCTNAMLNTKITDIENKKPNITGLVTWTNFNSKVTDIENKIPDVTDLISINIKICSNCSVFWCL